MICKMCEVEIDEGECVESGTCYTPLVFCSERCMRDHTQMLWEGECDYRYDAERDRKLMGEDD